MRDFSSSSVSFINKELKQKCLEAVSGATHLAEAAQAFCKVIGSEFSTSILVRIFATSPLKLLPEPNLGFVRNLAQRAGVLNELHEKTKVLNLMGTHGRRPEWCDRFKSQGHLGIPLVSAQFVEAIPMMSRLLNEFGIGVGWIGADGATDLIVQSMGRLATVFYVPDATTYRDQSGRLVISAQDFVLTENVKTVFGIGGAYNDGTICIILIFTEESITQPVVRRFMSLVNFLKMETMDLIECQRLFS